MKKYPKFIYEKYTWKVSNNNLEIFFDFKIEPNIKFHPKVVIENIPNGPKQNLDNLVFHLGLIEMISYWKATCSPVIEIKAGHLNSEQIKWWRDLIIKGMGQFFFENKIDWRSPKFLTIKAVGLKLGGPITNTFKNRYLVPIGGGKESIVTLELLKKKGGKEAIKCICLNPTETVKKVIRVGECNDPVFGKRKVEKKLLEMNRQGFLNGHTPISAYFAFFTTLAAIIFDYRYIAMSNEKSSNEGNVKYLGRTINHQWSKSSEFEKMYTSYCKKYLAKNIKYFSFLRSKDELQIAKIFPRFSKYFPVFLSCNEAYKTASGTKKPTKKWCCKCSKCLFVFAILYPFLKEKDLIKIFGRNLFEDKSLLPIMQQLIGKRGFKPFECVGTKKESITAFRLSLKKAKKLGKTPFLLRMVN